jgi:uncharacterized membrane protein
MLLRDRIRIKYLVFLSVLPILSLVSVLILNCSGNNLLTCATVFVVTATIVVFFWKGLQLSTLYPLALFVIGLSLLLGSSLANSAYHVHGYDMQGEYYVYQLTAKNGNWQPLQFPFSNPPSADSLDAYSSCLSITILPTMISLVTGYNGEMIFLLLYPIILSFSLPVIYYVLHKRIGAQYAFLSALLMLNFTYVLEITGLARQEIALFLFSVAILVMFSGEGSKRTRYLLFLIISFGIITSHYATGYVYMLVLSVLAVADHLFGGTIKRHGQIRIGFFSFLLVFCLGFSWYIFTIGPFSQMISLLSHTVQRFNDLFAAPRNLGPIGLSTQFPLGYRVIENTVSYLIQLFLLLGILSFASRYRKNNKRQSTIEKHIVFLALSIFATLAIFTLLPIASVGYGTERLYVTLLPFLLFFFAEGVSWFSQHVGISSERPKGVLMVTIVVLQIVISAGLLSLAFGTPLPNIASLSEVVQATGPSDLEHFVLDQEVSANRWFSQHYDKNETVYADEYEILRLWSYGGVALANTLTGDALQLHGQQGYVLLRYENVVYDTIEGQIVTQKNVSQLSAFLSSTDRIYDTNGTLIYQIGHPAG